LLDLLKKNKLKTALHISTQANCTSRQTAATWNGLGASRVNLARELSLQQIAEIQKSLYRSVEIEVFIHGAVCFSYSGRCAISDYMTGYRANRGQCKHPCRYQYYLVEEKRPGKYMPVFEDNRGLYLFNSKDLALFEYIPQLTDLGIASFKIEGRMKSLHYIATVVSFYRRLMDGRPFTKKQALDWLGRVPNRGYTAGFMKGDFGPDDYASDQSVSQGTSRFVANVTESGPDGCTIRVRNTICAGDTLEVLTPDGSPSTITLPAPLHTAEGRPLDSAKNEQRLALPFPLPPYTILRKVLPDKTD